MGTRKATASYQAIDLVRAAISTPYVRASDAAVARALGVAPGTVGGFKSGREVMSMSMLAKAQEFMQLSGPQLAELSVAISMDGAKDPAVQGVWEAIREAVKGKAASILLAGCIAWAPLDDAAALEKQPNSRTLAPDAASEQCILCQLASRLRNAARRFVRWFPVPPLLPAQLPAM